MAARSTPKDAQAMASLLSEMGVVDYEPRVLNQMLEFTYRYVTCVLDDGLLYSQFAKKKSIDIDDIRLAINLQQENFTQPPPRELTAELARQRNSMPLPLIKSSAGLRLPPDRYSLTSCNYHLKSATRKTRTVHTVSRVNLASLPPITVSKSNPAISLNKTGSVLVTKANAAPTAVNIMGPTINVLKPSPSIKFPSDVNRPVTTQSGALLSVSSALPVNLTPQQIVGVMNQDFKLPTDDNMAVKRKYEDTDYDAD